MQGRLKWGILSTGKIAKKFAAAIIESSTGELFAVGSRSLECANAFGDQFGVPRRYKSYEDLLADADVQAVYIATPHPLHVEWCMKAAKAKKHILCEKPLALNHASAMAAIKAARKNDVFLMEAFMYRCHPQTRALVDLIKKGEIGEIRKIEAQFSFNASFDEKSRLYNNDLGGGGILDVGCYPASAARLVAGAALGKDFAEPLEIKAVGHIGASHVDEWSCACLKFPNDIIAEISAGIGLNLDNVLRVFGSMGRIVVPNPWLPGRDNSTPVIYVRKDGAQETAVTIPNEQNLYAYEADSVARNLDRRQAPSPAMTWDDTLGNMRLLDTWRKQIGLVYSAEEPETMKKNRANRPLKKSRRRP